MRAGIVIGLVALGAACGGTVGDDSNASDAGKNADATSSDVTVKASSDAGDGDAGDGACPSPASVSGFTPAPIHPANIVKGACTTAQIDGYYKACLAPSPDCNAFVAANASCVDCLVTPSTDSSWGALVIGTDGTSKVFNATGCIQALTGDSSATSCAQKFDDVFQCLESACDAQCPLTKPEDVPLFEQCVGNATNTVCASWVAAECSTDAGFYTECVAAGSNDPEAQFDAIGAAMCGP